MNIVVPHEMMTDEHKHSIKALFFGEGDAKWDNYLLIMVFM